MNNDPYSDEYDPWADDPSLMREYVRTFGRWLLLAAVLALVLVPVASLLVWR